MEECFGQFDTHSFDNLMSDQEFNLECENEHHIQNDTTRDGRPAGNMLGTLSDILVEGLSSLSSTIVLLFSFY